MKAITVSLVATLIPIAVRKTTPFYITRHEQVHKSEDELLLSLEEGIFLIGGIPTQLPNICLKPSFLNFHLGIRVFLICINSERYVNIYFP